MNKTNINDISFIQKKNFVKQSCLMYNKIKKTRETLKRFNGEKKYDLGKFDPISLFENILQLLDRNEKLIIEKDFIGEPERSNWYLDYWSKSSYYKYKNDAVDKFLNLLFS